MFAIIVSQIFYKNSKLSELFLEMGKKKEKKNFPYHLKKRKIKKKNCLIVFFFLPYHHMLFLI